MRVNKNAALLSEYVLSTLIFFLAGLNIGCGSAQEAKSDGGGAENIYANDEETVTNVATGLSERKNFDYIINSTGKIKSLYDQIITSEIGGEIMICDAQNGKSIYKGDQIIQLRTDLIEQKLERSTLTKFSTGKEYESQLLGYANLLNGKSTEQAEDIKQKLRISSGLAMAEQDIKEARYELTRTCIKAPFSGTLANVKVQTGEQITPGEELLRIYDPKNLFAEIKILETDIAYLKKGMTAEVSPIANPLMKYKAVIIEVNPYIDENGMGLAKIKIVDPNVMAFAYKSDVLFPGMNCTTVIRIPFGKALVVPKPAVVFRNNKPVVFTVEKGKAKWNYVALGRDNGVEVEIENGLRVGQKVITTNNLQLGNNAPVKEISRDSSGEE